MDAVTASHERSGELAALRRRAYGPDADIERDPNALRRLYELEDLAHAPAEDPSREDTEPPVDVAGAASDPSLGSDDERDVIAPATDDDAPSDRVRRWWRSGTLWAVASVSLVVGLAIGAATLGVSSRAAGPDVTLKPIGEGERDQVGIENLHYWGVEPDSVVRYESYDTIDVLTGTVSGGSRCVLLAFASQLFTASCAQGDLDPVLDFSADHGWPAPLTEPLGLGGVIRFIAGADGVDVWVRPAVPTPPGNEE